MKLQSVMNRCRAKEATDLLDITRLTSTRDRNKDRTSSVDYC